MNVELASLGYIYKDGQYLLLHRNKKENDTSLGKWVAVGGKIEEGESPDDALIREVKEETGLDVISYNMKGVVCYPEFYPGVTEYMFIYEITEFDGDLIEDCKEGELKWIDKQDINDLHMWEGDKLIFKWMDQSFFSAKIKYENDTMNLESIQFNS